MDKNIGDLYDELYANALELKNSQGELEKVSSVLEAAKTSVESVLLHRIRVIFEIPIGIDMPHDLLEDDGVEKMIHQFQNAIKQHIKNPGDDSYPHIAEADKIQLRKIAEDIGWGEYLTQNENITLLMAKRLKDAIQLKLIPDSYQGISLDPNIVQNLHSDTRRHNQKAGVGRPGFRSSRGRIRG